MFLYTENDTESDTRIQDNNVYYKTHPKYNNTLQTIHHFRKTEIVFVSCYFYKKMSKCKKTKGSSSILLHIKFP